LSFSIEDSVAHAANLRRGIYVGKLQPALASVLPVSSGEWVKFLPVKIAHPGL
jgi:hypothetical protein